MVLSFKRLTRTERQAGERKLGRQPGGLQARSVPVVRNLQFSILLHDQQSVTESLLRLKDSLHACNNEAPEIVTKAVLP